MRFSTTFAAAAVTLASVVSAAQFNVEVGKDNQNVFAPTSITGVQAGDTVTFRFTSKSHSVTQSTFEKPCEAKAGGVDSGFKTVDAASGVVPEWTIKIENVTTPHWFYCARAPHCTGAGMVFAINPTEARSFDLFQNIAKGVAQPPAPTNGTNGTATTSTPSAGSPLSTSTSATPGASGTGTPAGTNSPPNGAAALSAHKAATALVALGLVASLTL